MNSKRKGNHFEREMAKFLSRWYEGNETSTTLYFWRDLGSGTTSIHNRSHILCGDLLCFIPDPDFSSSLWIELKYYSGFRIDNLSLLKKFISQIPENKNSFLFVKCRRGIYLVCKKKLDTEFYMSFKSKGLEYFLYDLKEVRKKNTFKEVFYDNNIG
jgi:hypothetical protein